MTICPITAGIGVSFLKHGRTNVERTDGRTDRRGSRNSYLDESFLIPQVWLRVIKSICAVKS